VKIVLTGFMGTGKSSVGKILAKKLKVDCIDTDRLIEERTGQPIAETFRTCGEPFFRSLEKEIIKEEAKKSDMVIAVGGGAILDPENLANLKNDGTLISLLASPEEIEKRTAGDDSRPLLKSGGKTMEQLLAQRLPFYRKADICVDTEGKEPWEVADEIIERIETIKKLKL
jgi:shikimate kinase